MRGRPPDGRITAAWDRWAPYFQSQRLDIYAKYLAELKAAGLAYPTFDSKAEVLEAEPRSGDRRRPSAHGHVRRGDARPGTRPWRAQGKEPASRFRLPESGVTEFEDLVHGRMRFENRLMADFVIVRSDGMPTYNFAASIDDSLMAITHVIRGDDHLSNTPRQVCLYRALGLTEPAFAHIPMILGPDKQRLSKRHGATAVGEYEAQGFLPEAMLNFLALLGWSLDDKTTLISVDDLKKHFSLERVTKHPAVFDPVKLEWMNGQYVKQSDLGRVADLAWPHFVRAGLLQDADKAAKSAWFEKLVASLKEKVRTPEPLARRDPFLLQGTMEQPSAEALSKFKEARAAGLAGDFAARLAATDFNAPALEAASRAYADEKAVKFKHLVGAVQRGLERHDRDPGPVSRP